MLAILFPTRCASLNFPLWVFVFVAVVGVSMRLIGVAIVLSRAAEVSAILAPAVTVGERRELWILPPFFFGLFFCL